MRWESNDRWYYADIERDLFGLVVVQRWGGRFNRRGGAVSRPVSSWSEAGRLMSRIASTRIQRGYRPRDDQ